MTETPGSRKYNDYDPDGELSRDNFPLTVGETVVINGDTLRFKDFPTDGPLFVFEDGLGAEVTLQLDLHETKKHRDALEAAAHTS